MFKDFLQKLTATREPEPFHAPCVQAGGGRGLSEGLSRTLPQVFGIGGWISRSYRVLYMNFGSQSLGFRFGVFEFTVLSLAHRTQHPEPNFVKPGLRLQVRAQNGEYRGLNNYLY